MVPALNEEAAETADSTTDLLSTIKIMVEKMDKVINRMGSMLQASEQ